MKQLELFEISFEEKRFLKMIRVLEKKTDEIDLLKYELTHLKIRLEENIRKLDLRLNPYDDFRDTFSYDEEFDHISSTSKDYLVDKSDLNFEYLEPNEETKFH